MRRSSFLAGLFHLLTRLALWAMRFVSGARQHVFRTSDGVALRYVRVARPGRPAAVLIHGFSDRPETFLRTARRLRRYDLILPELPGFHDGVEEGRAYTVDSYARWVAELLDALDVRAAHVCGNSLGGATGLLLAGRRPDLVRTLIPLDTGGVDAPGVPSIHDEVRAGHNLFLVDQPSGVPVFLSRIFHRPPPVVGPARSLFAAELQAKAPTYARIMEDLEAEGERYAERGTIVPLDAIRAPVLVAWGEHDSLFPLAVGEHLARSLPDAELHVFREVGHCPHLECPGALAEVCDRFWSAHQGAHAGELDVR